MSAKLSAHAITTVCSEIHIYMHGVRVQFSLLSSNFFLLLLLEIRNACVGEERFQCYARRWTP